MSKQTTAPSEPIRDARKLGTGKMLILGIQHMFAMFGATILVPIITGLSVQVTLICAGLGTLFSIFAPNLRCRLFWVRPLLSWADLQR